MSPDADRLEPRGRGVATVGASAVVFLSLCDLVFAVRTGGVNLRFAHAALAVPLVAEILRAARTRASEGTAGTRLPLLVAAALGVSLLVTTLGADAPLPTAVRAAWFAANLGSAVAFAAWAARERVLGSALTAGVVAVAAVVWIDALAIHWGGGGPALGTAQTSYPFEGAAVFRPHAFHYEPSYAATALALGFVTALAPWRTGPSAGRAGLAGVILAAIVLTTSRAGVAAVAATTAAAAIALPFFAGGTRLLGRLALSWIVAAALLGGFALHPGGARYLRFAAGPLGPAKTIQRIGTVVRTWDLRTIVSELDRTRAPRDESPRDRRRESNPVEEGRSEVNRIDSWLLGFREWRRAPWFGRGASFEREASARRSIDPGPASGWAGLLVEFGAVGAALWISLWAALWRALRPAPPAAAAFLGTAFLAHAGVTLVVGPSFLRLDFCVLLAGLLFAAASGAGRGATPAAPTAPRDA